MKKMVADGYSCCPLARMYVGERESWPRGRSCPHVYRVIAAVTEIRAEEDGDLHVILRNGRFHMIAEAPSPGCFARAKLVRKVQMLVARRAVRVCRRAEVTGVAFFDYLHGQIGVAPNAVELHPILKFLCLSG
jgi:hypothetical protein